MAERLILGVDPGLSITGYGVLAVSQRGRPTLKEAGVIRCSRSQTLEQRLAELYSGIQEILDAHAISALAIEQLYSHYERPRTAILMGHARGVLCLAAAQANLAVHSYLPTRVKKSLTGNGRAPKTQVQYAVKQQLSLATVPDPPDVADALAVALCHHFATLPTAISL